MSNVSIQINENNVTVNKNSLSFSQYTVSHIVYLNVKMMNENLKGLSIEQRNKELCVKKVEYFSES